MPRITSLSMFILAESILLTANPSTSLASIFGEENIALLKLVTGQIAELEKLTNTVGILENQRDILLQINGGIERAITQIQTLEEIAERSHGLEPSSIQDLTELNRQIDEAKLMAGRAQELMQLKLSMVDLSVSQAAIQSDTAYRMGQEMIGTGSILAEESRSASPGRAAQISASAEVSQMLAQGIQLQGMAHLLQIQAETLDLQKSVLNERITSEKAQQNYFRADLGKISVEKLGQTRKPTPKRKASSTPNKGVIP